jgi:enoyl-CoA hydratase/carnithine racemase
MEAGIANVVLNRPERRNAMSVELLAELNDVLAKLETEGEAKVVVISGAGPVFSAGHDISEMIDRESEFFESLFGLCTDVMLRLQAMPIPVIARVHGMATAAGCQLVAACDLAVASTDCRFATPGVKIGLFCSTPMVPIVRSIGRKRALQMLLTGEPIDATTALDWGLVNRVVPAADLDDAVESLAQRIMRFSPEVLSIGKRAFYTQVDRPEPDAYDIAGPIMSGNAAHEDAQAGMKAFLDKTAPDWPSQR